MRWRCCAPRATPRSSHSSTGPNVWAFWQPRFQRIAAWWLGVERERRTPLMTAIATEIATANWCCRMLAPPFTLTARADRIDIDGATAA